MNGDDVTRRLRDLAAQHAGGMLSDRDYATQKQALLGRPGGVGGQETQMMPAIEAADSEQPDRAERPGRSLWRLVIAVGIVIAVLIAVVVLTAVGVR